MTNNETFGEYLCRHREEKGLSQLELSQLINVSQAAIGQWERNIFVPKSNKLHKIAEVLEIPYDEIKQLVSLAKKQLSINRASSKVNGKSKNRSENHIYDFSNTTNLSGMSLLSKLANALENNLLNPQQISIISSLIKTFQYDNSK